MKRMNLSLISALLLAVVAVPTTANSAEIVYPKSNNVVINSAETFFIGNEKPDKALKINGENVSIHSSGGFWHVVKLDYGENKFVIDNGNDTQIYNITRNNTNSTIKEESTYQSYKKPLIIETNADNVPLRSMPNDFGLNRLQHLQKHIQMKVVGEFGNYYKVQLSRDDFAWLSKDYANKLDTNDLNIQRIIALDYHEDSTKRIYEIKLSDKVPYTLSESDGLDLVVYNVKDYPYNKYEFHIANSGKLFGYKSYYTDDNRLIIEVKKFPDINKSTPLKGLKIAIDAGHGGTELGAIGCLNDNEKDVNLEISKILKEKLETNGANVIMTREDDSFVGLNDRVEIADKNNAQIFISIHNNALPDSAAHLKSTGSETYYFYPQSKELAKDVVESLAKETGFKNNGAKAQSFAVVRNTNCPAILVEVGYIINPEDNAKLIDKNYQNKIAEAILHGLENYLK